MGSLTFRHVQAQPFNNQLKQFPAGPVIILHDPAAPVSSVLSDCCLIHRYCLLIRITLLATICPGVTLGLNSGTCTQLYQGYNAQQLPRLHQASTQTKQIERTEARRGVAVERIPESTVANWRRLHSQPSQVKRAALRPVSAECTCRVSQRDLECLAKSRSCSAAS